MYLSSFRLGDEPERLLALLPSARPVAVAVIGNAMDAAPDVMRRTLVSTDLAAMNRLGLAADEVDLRDYVDRPGQLAAVLERYQMVWVRGGNTFVLRHAMARSGADAVLTDLLRRDALVYAGYSAGCCVLAPSLRGLELVDDPRELRDHHGVEPIWTGLGLIDYAIVPHYRSGHPESAAIDLVAERYRAEGVPHRLLRDGEAIVINESR